jgi:hypothetical protein
VGVNDIEAVSRNTGLTVDEISRLKNHLFLEKHLVPKQGGLLTKHQYLDADDDIARIWTYSQNNDITKYDSLRNWFRKLADHELEESRLMKEGMSLVDDWDSSLGRYIGGAHYQAPKPPTEAVERLMKELGLI